MYGGGTAAIMMKILLELDQCNRKFYVFDSFEGFPEPSIYDKHKDGTIVKKGEYNVSQDIFVSNMKKLNVWNESVMIISKGGCCCQYCVYVALPMCQYRTWTQCIVLESYVYKCV